MTELPDPTAMLDRVAAHRPSLRTAGRAGWQAATALVLAGAAPQSVLVIQRVTRTGDPWSGDAALPGGKREEQDVDLAATARRETLEEVGVVLPEPVGRLDDVGGRVHRGTVSPFVFHLDDEVPLTLQASEVARALWVPLRVLVDPGHRTRTPTRAGPFPAWEWDGLVIWGLTRGVLQNFLEVVGTR